MTTGQIIYFAVAICAGFFALIKFYLQDRDEIKERLSRIEERNKNLPTHDDMRKLYDKMNELSANQSYQAGVMKANLTTIEMLVKQVVRGEMKNG